MRTVHYVIVFCLGFIASILLTGYVQPGTVSAATGCGVNSDNIHDYAGLVVYSRYKVVTRNEAGKIKNEKWGRSENTGVRVKTIGETTTKPGGIIDLNTGKHYAEKVFYQSESPNCGYDKSKFNSPDIRPSNTYMTLGTGGSSPDAGSGSRNWALDCDNSIRASRPDLNDFQRFSVTGTGVPKDAPGGGEWNVRQIDPPNGKTWYVTITYVVTVVDPDKDDGESKNEISCTRFVRELPENARFQFVFFAKGVGYDPPQARGAPLKSPQNNPLPSAGRWNDYGGQSGWIAQERNVKASDQQNGVYRYRFPAKPSENWRGWRVVIERWQRTGAGTQGNPYKWNFTSTINDANCNAWVLTPRSSVDRNYVELGQTANFTHVVNNSGNVEVQGVSSCAMMDNECINSISGSFPVGDKVMDDPEYHSQKAIFIDPGSQICQRYKVMNRSFLHMSTPRESSDVCTKVVGGSTGVSASGQKGSLEPGENQEFTINVHTSNFAGHSDWGGYNPNCTYNLIRKIPGQQFSQGTTIGASNRSCSSGNINGNGNIPTKVNYTATEADFGYEVCLVAQLNISNSYFRKKNIQGQDTEQRAESSCAPIIHRPLLNVQAGDVSVGNGFSDESCMMNLGASIIGWNKNNAPGYHGSGTTFAAFAHGVINGFAAGQNLPTTGGYGNAPNKLAFANATANVSAGKYGGDFGSGTCIPDYYGDKPEKSQSSWPGWGAANGHARADQVYSVTSSSIAGGINGGKVDIGSNIRLYVDGDVYIKSNITPNINEEINDPADVPNFTLVARGNIYIAHGVTELYGTYVAQPSEEGNGGIIRTCTQSNSATFGSTAQRYDLCSKQLTVEGSLIAQKILFHRTKGSLYMANGSLDNAAEVIKYNPLLGLRQSTGGGTPGGIKYDSITTLPPIL